MLLVRGMPQENQPGELTTIVVTKIEKAAVLEPLSQMSLESWVALKRRSGPRTQPRLEHWGALVTDSGLSRTLFYSAL